MQQPVKQETRGSNWKPTKPLWSPIFSKPNPKDNPNLWIQFSDRYSSGCFKFKTYKKKIFWKNDITSKNFVNLDLYKTIAILKTLLTIVLSFDITAVFSLRGGSRQKYQTTLPSVLATLTDWSIRIYYKAVNLASFLAMSAGYSKFWLIPKSFCDTMTVWYGSNSPSYLFKMVYSQPDFSLSIEHTPKIAPSYSKVRLGLYRL